MKDAHVCICFQNPEYSGTPDHSQFLFDGLMYNNARFQAVLVTMARYSLLSCTQAVIRMWSYQGSILAYSGSGAAICLQLQVKGSYSWMKWMRENAMAGLGIRSTYQLTLVS